MKYSYGNQEGCACPSCGEKIEYPWVRVNKLFEDLEITCNTCYETITIDGVETTVDIVLSFNEK